MADEGQSLTTHRFGQRFEIICTDGIALIDLYEKHVKHLQSLLTPRRIDKDTPDGVLVWTGGSWVKASRASGYWVDMARFRHYPVWWLPMLPAPEDYHDHQHPNPNRSP